jgi:hypothetical protein
MKGDAATLNANRRPALKLITGRRADQSGGAGDGSPSPTLRIAGDDGSVIPVRSDGR